MRGDLRPEGLDAALTDLRRLFSDGHADDFWPYLDKLNYNPAGVADYLEAEAQKLPC